MVNFMTMQALRLTNDTKGPVLLDMPLEVVSETQIKIRIHACGLNFADLLMIRDKYQDMPPRPFTMGLEYAGIVDAIGDQVSKFQVGDRVAAFVGHGGLAQYAVIDQEDCIALSRDADLIAAAGTLITHGTSHLALTDRAGLVAGQTLLVLGAAGGVGLSAVAIGKALGARVIAVARGKDKCAIAQKAGADITFENDDPDLVQHLKALGGVDVVYDPVGGDLFKAALRGCKTGAQYLLIGFASGDLPDIPANILLVKNISMHGFYWGGVKKYDAATFQNSLSEVLDMVATGKVDANIHHVMPFDQTLEAFEMMRARQSTGKIVITLPMP